MPIQLDVGDTQPVVLFSKLSELSDGPLEPLQVLDLNHFIDCVLQDDNHLVVSLTPQIDFLHC